MPTSQHTRGGEASGNGRGQVTRYEELKPGDRIVVEQKVTVGTRSWIKRTVGTVVRTERQHTALHFDRAADDPVFADAILLEFPDGELTTITMDEFTVLRRAE